MATLAKWTSRSGRRFMVTRRDIGHGCISWTARTPWGAEIVSGITTKPHDDATRAAWAAEVKEAVETT